MPKVQPHNDNSATTYEPLLDTESSLMFFLSEPAISTISFFQGDVDIEASKLWLKERLTQIVTANPWLAGRLEKNKKVHKNLLLAIPQPVTSEDVDALICNDEDGSLSTETKYEVICDRLLKSKMVVGPGYKLVGKDLRCSKFTLAKVGQGQVALVVSITHAVSDGHTYYKIMSMLNGDVEKLSSTRKFDFINKSMEAIGSKESKYLSSFSFLLCCLKSMLFGGKAKLDARYIDENLIKEWKDSAHDGFISTNDIVTSTFAKATNSDLLLMAINLRNRVEDAKEDDAGNYSLVVLHDKESSATPSGVRQLLNDGPPFTRKNDKLPGFFKTVTSKVFMITNWAFPSFKADLALPSASGEGSSIPLELHLPIPYHPKEIAFPICVIFRPCEGSLAVLYGGSPQTLSSDRLLGAKAPLGETISKEMFCFHG